MHLRKMIGQDEYNDDDRARLRSITVGKLDGMSSIRGKVSPRFAAALQRLLLTMPKQVILPIVCVPLLMMVVAMEEPLRLGH